MTNLTTNIAGVTFDKRQNYLNYIKKQNTNDIQIYLRREPKNPHDANAIRVFARNKTTGKYADLGYITGETAKTLAPVMDSGVFIRTKNYTVTGFSQKTLGLNVTLCY